MAHTNALINVETVVSRFLFKYKLSTDDALIYTEHVCNAIRDFNLYDGDLATTAKVTVNANKWIEMPSDLIGFIDLVIPYGGGLVVIHMEETYHQHYYIHRSYRGQG